MKAKQLYKSEKKVINELYELGLISHFEMTSQKIKNLAIYVSQVKDSQ